MIKGYARVSSADQKLDVQLSALKAAGATYIYSEKQSGAKNDRQQFKRCIAQLQPGDVLLVTKLDRLARSSRDLLNTLHEVDHAGATFKSIGDPWADTTTPTGKLLLTIMGGMAEFERHLILSRTDEGRKLAKARGVKFGRKPKLTPHQQREVLSRLRTGNETLRQIAATYNVSQMVIHRLARACA